MTFSIVFAAMFSANAAVSSTLYDDNVSVSAQSMELSFESDGEILNGTLHKPEGEGPFPAVVAMHGAGPPERDSPIYLHLARAMTQAGAAVLLFDRRDIAVPPEERTSIDYRILAADGAAAARELASLASVDAERVGIWGISQGGWLAPMAYTMDPDAISFQILVSPSGDGPAGQMMYAAERNLRDAGLDEETVETGLALRETIYAYFRHEISREEAQAAVDAHKDEPWFDLLHMGREVREDPTTSGWYEEMRFEPWEYFAQVNTPVALIYGEDDPITDVERSIEVFRAAFAEAGNDDYEIHRVPTTGHAMLDNEREVLASGVEITPDHFSDAYARIMADFVQRTGRDD